jgi:hypothetical protein
MDGAIDGTDDGGDIVEAREAGRVENVGARSDATRVRRSRRARSTSMQG